MTSTDDQNQPADTNPACEPDTQGAAPEASAPPAEDDQAARAAEDGSQADEHAPAAEPDDVPIDSAGTVDGDDDASEEADVDDETAATVEAILFATDSPLNAGRIAQVAELPRRAMAKRAVEQLNARYAEMGCAFRIEQIAGGYQMLTLAEYNDVLSNLLRARKESRLSQAALETLAIIAYRQPILRADVEAIRGVACGEVLRGLMERGLIKIVGRAEVLGRPMLYGTTRRFLEVFGLASLKDLPNAKELRQPSAPAESKPAENKESAPAEPGDETADNPAEPQEPAQPQTAEKADEKPTGESEPQAESGQPETHEAS